MKNVRRILGMTWASVFLLISTVHADWPTYLGNHGRTGTTGAKIELSLQPSWVYDSPAAPRTAWTGPEGRVIEGKQLHDRVRFDDALQVAVVGKRVYFGSTVDHQLHCKDLATGENVWSFYTGAPIRLAPTVSDGLVFFGSDDGRAYCLNAATGKRVWSIHLGFAEEWIVARGELISRWPVRTGVLVDKGVAYFGAGIFPHENVYMAAVDAKTGKMLWKNDKISHIDAGRNDLSPQGYLLATDDRIYVPSGRSRPRAFVRATGAYTGAGATSHEFAATAIAGTDALVADGRLHVYSLGTRFCMVGESSYVATGKEVLRMNRKEYAVAAGKRKKINSQIKDLEKKLRNPGDKLEEYKQSIAQLRKSIQALAAGGVQWRAKFAGRAALVVTDNLTFVGGNDRVVAFDNADGTEAWSADVQGEARGIAVANGYVLISTTVGKIYCFSDATTNAVTIADSADRVADPYPRDQWTPIYERAAKEILKQTNITRGFCLVVGSEQGRLAYELAKRSDLRIYGVEPDASKVAASRKIIAQTGLYGSRITIHQADLASIGYSNYFANLVVSDRLLLNGVIPDNPEKLARHVKPAGGVVCFGRPPNAPGKPVSAEDLTYWLGEMGLDAQATIKHSGSWATLTRGMLAGAGNWSHQYADPGNSANSGDELVKGGLGVLWYGDPGPDMMVNRHQGAVGPLVVDGRLFVQGEDNLMAYDAYNGQFLWQVPNPKAIRTGVFQNRTPGNLAAGDGRLFHMVRDFVYEHDAATGKVIATHPIPDSIDKKTHEWGYLAYRDGLLFGTATIRGEVADQNRRRRGDPGAAATDSIFAIEIKTGKHLWVYKGKSINFQTIAIGPGRVYFIDSSVTSEQRAEILRQDKSELKTLTGEAAKNAEARMKKLDVRLAVGLDARTGERIWDTAVDVTDCSEIGIGGGKLTMLYHDDVLLLCGANANGHYWKQFVGGEFSRRRIVALYALEGYKLWAKDANYRHRPIVVGDRVIAEPWAFDLKSGKQKMREHPLTGKQVPWSVMRPGHHCGMLTASNNMLLFRSGFTGFYDLENDDGTRHFAGHRLGCWINAVPANGLVVIPEASAGCVCMFSIASTIVMEPRPARRPWTLYSGIGTTTPVEHMALNLGAPGDRRDGEGKLWLAYPRPTPNRGLQTSLDLPLQFETAFQTKGTFFSRDGDVSIASTKLIDWLGASGALGLSRISLPLLGKEDQPGVYSVKLFFKSEPSDKPGDRVFDVVVQGQTVLRDVDATVDQESAREVSGIKVTQNLLIEIKQKTSPQTSPPMVSAIEVRRTGG